MLDPASTLRALTSAGPAELVSTSSRPVGGTLVLDALRHRLGIDTRAGCAPTDRITADARGCWPRHADITGELGIPISFCDPHAPWQRGSNENANGLPRQYFLKRTDLSIHSPEHLRAVEDDIDARPAWCSTITLQPSCSPRC